ncbi:uncharacterized protein METZ01_LOCUS87692 [marine metagenome]|uniref:Phage tail protein n=1 Tax=marine metagenome TaxID=408172 RepID=A0A381V4X8_9ZZZZ
MASLAQQPKNINPLADVQFKFEIAALPNTSFFVQSCNLPGISLDAASIPTPLRTNLSRHTGIVTYEALDITFMIDEYLKNWQEVYEWMIGDASKYTTAVLTILSSSMNPTMEIHFKDIFPTTLSAIPFDSTTTDPVYQVATISFNYTEYIIKNLLNN